MRYSVKNIILIIIIGMIGCIEPFDPNIPNSNKDHLVIDGIITDQPGPYIVKITKSTPLDYIGQDDTSVSGVTVTIEEEEGVIETLYEESPGVYMTNAIQGVVGKRYRLNLSYGNSNYQSSWETIEASAKIDSVYYQVETRATTDKDIELTGLQFYVDSQGDQENVKNHRYEWEETWEIGVTYPSQDDFLEGGLILPAENPVYQCWKFKNSETINLNTTEGLSKNIISAHQLAFITGEDERFIKKYSLLVKQFALDESEYLFWKFLKEANEELGTLYDKQPSKIIGNISSLSNSDEVVLGYFSASGVQQTRVFVKAFTVNISERDDCGIPLDTLFIADLEKNFNNAVLEEISNGKYFFGSARAGRPPILVVGALLSHKKCSDCRIKGGDLKKPDFWDE
jgi:hypothetical protein